MSKSLRRPALIATFLLSSALGAASAIAQPAPAPVGQAVGPPGSAADDLAIVITGTRLLRPAITQPNPIISVDDQSILRSGKINLVDHLQEVPALVGSSDSSRTTRSPGLVGLNLLNLRNLGAERTLVLVDGRRHVAQLPETAAVDIGTIPRDLIERIDVATGGVSAVYGADAVSGVVNFVMKKDFDGLIGRVQNGVGSRGDPRNWTASLVGGKNFASDRGNITLAYQFTHEGRLKSSDREYLRGTNYCTMQRNPADPSDDPAIPDQVPLCGVRFVESSAEGAIDLNFNLRPDVRPNGEPFDTGSFVPPFYAIGGMGTLRADYIGDLLAESDRHVVNASLQYQLSHRVNFFAEAKYAHGKSGVRRTPTFDYGVFISAENPFVSRGLRNRILPGSGSLLSRAFGLPGGTIPDGFAVARDNFDLGLRGERATRETWRTVVGVKGDVTSDVRFELSYVYGQTKNRDIFTNNRFNDRFFAAIDVVTDPATGQPTCRSNLDPTALPGNYTYDRFRGYFFDPANLSFTPGATSGCLPLNILGDGVASAGAIDWVMIDSSARSTLTQDVVSGFVTGNLPAVALPGGPIGFVIGGEWRKEASRTDPPPETVAGQTFGNRILPVKGDFSVAELFGELRLPMITRRPFFEALEASGAVRLSDYSTVGAATSWNFGARWAPVRDLALRATYARSVRAPNIGELFSPENQSFRRIDDPCDIANRNQGTQFRQANCAALLSPIGIDPRTFRNPISSSVPGLTSGNAALAEETAKSWTVGAVIRPRPIPGLTVAVDWYDIRIKDAVNTAGPQEIAELCVDQPTIDNLFCGALERSPVHGGIVNFIVQPENVAGLRTAGLDFEVNYRLDPAGIGMSRIGKIDFRLLGNYLDRLEFVPAPGAELDDNRTEQYAPRWQATLDVTWHLDPVTVNYGFNYFSKTKRYSNADLEGDPDLASDGNIHFNARHTHDLQAAFDVRDRFRFYVGINNFTDQKPDLSTFYPVNAIGRFFYAGARMKLDQLRSLAARH